jgi:hypothetical protein
LRRAATIAVVAATVVAGVGALALGPARPHRVLLYGDSLSSQSNVYFRELLTEGGDVELTSRAVAGTALCGWFDTMHEDARAVQPDVVILQFAGNNLPECVRGGPDDDVPLLRETADVYEDDLQTALTIFVSQGARVYVVAPPGNVGETEPAGPLEDRYAQVALAFSPEVQLVEAGLALRGDDGVYRSTMPCLAAEGESEGCADGRIPVRASDGGHFCDDDTGPSGACAAYASGAFRYARAMAEPVRQDLGV